MPTFNLTINGKPHQVDADPAMPLLWILRDRLSLFGTKFGCGVGICGACTVHDGGTATRSCTTPIEQAAGHAITTIEGLSNDGSHPCQRAWLEADVAQCGFCQTGMIMTAVALLRTHPQPSDAEIDAAFATHVCRCGTYTRVRAAMRLASQMARPR